MSTNENTPDAEPLHTATLLAVLAKLRDRLDAIPALVADDSDDHPLTHVELAGWEARVEALEGFAGDVALMLKDVHPRARVVVLPENIGGGVAVGGESYVHFIHGITGYSTGEVGVVGIHIAALGLLGRMPAAEAAAMGRSLIAAAEFAGGAQ